MVSQEELGGGLLRIIRQVSAKILPTNSTIAPTSPQWQVNLGVDDYWWKCARLRDKIKYIAPQSLVNSLQRFHSEISPKSQEKKADENLRQLSFRGESDATPWPISRGYSG